MSETYRQTSNVDRGTRLRDPFNRWLARQSRFRLDAELVRDSALALSGLLCDRIGGPSVKPYQPPGLLGLSQFSQARLDRPTRGADQYRRGLYTYWQRTFLAPQSAGFRRLDPGRVRRRSPPVEYAAASARAAQRPDLCRIGANVRRAHHSRGWRRPAMLASSWAFNWRFLRPPRGQEVPVLVQLCTTPLRPVPGRPGGGAGRACLRARALIRLTSTQSSSPPGRPSPA